MKKILFFSISIALIVFSVLGCSQLNKTPESSPTSSDGDHSVISQEDYPEIVEPVLSEWEEKVVLANDRSLSGWLNVIEDLSRLRNEFANLEIDPSMESFHSQMVLHMDCQVASHLALIKPINIKKMNLDSVPSFYFDNCNFNVEQ